MKNNYNLQQIGSFNRNKNLSNVTKDKVREKALISKNRIFSEKAFINKNKTSKPIILYNIGDTVFGEYTSIVEAAKKINCGKKTITRALKTEKKNIKKTFYSWIYKNINLI